MSRTPIWWLAMALASVASVAGAYGVYAGIRQQSNMAWLTDHPVILLAIGALIARTADLIRLRVPPSHAWTVLVIPVLMAIHGVTPGRTFHYFLDALMLIWVAVMWRRGVLKMLLGHAQWPPAWQVSPT